MGSLANEEAALESGTGNLALMVSELGSLVRAHRSDLETDLDILADVSTVLVRQKDNVLAEHPVAARSCRKGAQGAFDDDQRPGLASATRHRASSHEEADRRRRARRPRCRGVRRQWRSSGRSSPSSSTSVTSSIRANVQQTRRGHRVRAKHRARRTRRSSGSRGSTMHVEKDTRLDAGHEGDRSLDVAAR